MRNAAYRMFLDGSPATREQLDRFESVSVEQEVGRAWEGRLEVPVCLDDNGSWSGEDERFTSVFRRIRVEIRVGGGDFVPLIDGPIVGRDTTRSSEPGQSAITLVVHDDSVYLNRKAAVESFEGRADSDIAERMYRNQRQISDVIVERTSSPPSDESYEVMRRGTEMDLLRELGRRSDREVGVLPGTKAGASVGVFHSIPIPTSKLPGRPADLPALVLTGADRNIESFDHRFDAQRPTTVVAARLHFGDKTVIERRARYRDTTLVADVPGVEDGDVGEELLRAGAGGADLQDLVNALRNRRSRSFEATGTVRQGCYGGVLSPYRSLTVKLGGTTQSARYVVHRVTHRLTRSEYVQEFGLVSDSESAAAATASLIPGGIL